MRFLTILLGCLLMISPAFAQQNSTGFSQFLQDVQQDAQNAGIGQRGLSALSGATFEEDLIRLDRNQPEGRLTFEKYLQNTVTTTRIQRGRNLMAEHAPLLNRISAEYGVPARFIVALWGKETDYGRNSGGQNIIDALATLAYEGRRAEFFRKELIESLRIIDQGHIDADNMIGSWAGAMGQCQFMPSSFFKYAVDGDGDGRIDIWTNLADVFASTANYLRTEGWNNQIGWGREVSAPRNLEQSYIGKEKQLTLAQWSQLGVRALNGGPLPARELNASLVQPDGPTGRSYLIYDNFRVLLHWNKSTYFATSVGTLADAIGS